MQRRFPEEDAWVVPHCLYLAVFSLSSVNVLGYLAAIVPYFLLLIRPSACPVRCLLALPII